MDKGGLLVINGRFNPYDVSAIINFKDDSTKLLKTYGDVILIAFRILD